MNPIDHQRMRESLALFALDKLDAGERPALRDHVAACPRCRAELDDFREVAALLRRHSLTGLPFS
jgi:anti-sigma factor RsiW